MGRFDDLAGFVAVVRAGSFTGAAAQLGVTQSALSQTIRALERRLDLKLLNRTTRSVAPTEAGERLYQTVGPRFEDIEAELAVLGEMRGKPVGTVRITATEDSTRTLIWPRLARWLPLYPDIKVEITSDNRFADIVAARFDIGVRLASHGGLLKWEFTRRKKNVNAQVSGRLVPVLEEWAATFAGYHAYYASRRVSPAVMLIVNALRPPEST
jgi:DNA-binding transcriptional LysR family regulator